ncbi:MAG: hypothetical protein F6K09_30680 [Merismopedia sp. SIO2A8]|nr:hypothetical protein [Merismopedia sp. SIO2A8]
MNHCDDGHVYLLQDVLFFDAIAIPRGGAIMLCLYLEQSNTSQEMELLAPWPNIRFNFGTFF